GVTGGQIRFLCPRLPPSSYHRQRGQAQYTACARCGHTQTRLGVPFFVPLWSPKVSPLSPNKWIAPVLYWGLSQRCCAGRSCRMGCAPAAGSGGIQGLENERRKPKENTMILIELYTPKGSLNQEQRRQLAERMVHEMTTGEDAPE